MARRIKSCLNEVLGVRCLVLGVELCNYYLPAKRHEHIHIWAAQNNLALCGEAGYPLCEMSVKNCELSEPLGEFLQFSE